MKHKNTPVANSQLLVAEGKSSRLSAIRNKTQLQKQNSPVKKSSLELSGDLNAQQKKLLKQANQAMELRLDSILNSYPVAKKKAYFKLKYGVDNEQIKQLAMKEIFVILQLDTKKISHFYLIENLNSAGKAVGASTV